MIIGTSFSLDGIDGPADMVWLPAGFGGLQDARLVIVTRYSGHIALVDPVKVINGELRPVVARVQIGAVLNRVIADPVSGDLFVSDVKTRRIYRINAQDLEANDNPQVNGISIPTAARDLAINVMTDPESGQQTSTVVAALDDGLLELDGDDTETFISDVKALAVVNEQAIVGGAIATMSSGGLLRHAQPEDLQSSVPRPSSIPTGDRLVRRMIMLISPR